MAALSNSSVNSGLIRSLAIENLKYAIIDNWKTRTTYECNTFRFVIITWPAQFLDLQPVARCCVPVNACFVHYSMSYMLISKSYCYSPKQESKIVGQSSPISLHASVRNLPAILSRVAVCPTGRPVCLWNVVRGGSSVKMWLRSGFWLEYSPKPRPPRRRPWPSPRPWTDASRTRRLFVVNTTTNVTKILKVFGSCHIK